MAKNPDADRADTPDLHRAFPSVFPAGAAVFALTLWFLTGCADTAPIGLKISIPHTPAQQRRVITLANYFEFNPSHVSPRYHLPAGRYVATYEDANDINFPAPSKIQEKRIVGTFDLDGGLYLTKSTPHQLRVYCETQPGGFSPFETYPLPNEFLAAQGRYWSIEPPLN